MARQGEGADPRLAAPAVIRPVLGFSRLSAASYATIRRAVDDDDAFRARVAAAAPDETSVGRAGWLWLHRPDGWDHDPALVAAPAPDPDDGRLTRLRREREGAEAAAARYRARADEADAARRRVEAELDDLRRALDERDGDLRRQAADLADLSAERNAAVRSQKALEARLAAARRDLRVAREATRQAEADLLARAEPAVPITAGAQPDGSPAPAPPAVDGPAARAAVEAAADAAADLARALADAAHALGSPATSERGHHDAEPSTGRDADRRAPSARTGPRPARRRRHTALPPGMVAGTAAADRHLVRSGDVLVVVDGYNLARTAWTGQPPEEERRRTVALLEEVAARSGAAIEVVFDGDDRTTAPAASRVVLVRYSGGGQNADDAIADRVAAVPEDRPVVVVSTDRAVADDARRHGAEVLSSAAFLAAVGR